jgi:glutathione S-transferase
LRGDQNEPAYLKLNPNGVVPTLVHDDTPIVESSLILYYLDEIFPDPRSCRRRRRCGFACACTTN